MSIPSISFRPDAAGPLQGLVVLDLSRLVAGNMVSLQLADYGAEVIKLEDPKKGDPLRDWRTDGLSVHWKVYGRNKKSLTLSLRTEEGKDLLRRLLPLADVMIENFRPGTLEEMGLGPDALHAIHPGLVLVRVSGWGQDGPYRERPGFGTLVEGVSGFAAKNGFPDRPPVLPPLALADMIAGLYGAYAVMVALRHRDRTGHGQVIDLPLLDPIFSILGPEAAQFKLTGRIPQRTGSQSRTASPRNAFRTRDGRWIAISASIQSMAERVYAAVGRPDMIQDPRFRTNADRIKVPDEAEAPIRDFIAARDFADVMAHFAKEEVTAAPIYDIDQFLEDPHVQARGIVVELPDREMGTVPMHNVVPRLSDSPGAIRTPAPELGEHTAEVLARIGVAAGELERLRSSAVI
ncbi:CaiB/BaiF CoA transferase family protein [Stella sp.]|uniref:CaiB/BaiF CoA transferase family protein n=1 Tax=Stella sp. TaxID=2912054 RepID=UPI0035AFE340